MLGRLQSWLALLGAGVALAAVHGCAGKERPFATDDEGGGLVNGGPSQEMGSLQPSNGVPGAGEAVPGALDLAPSRSPGARCAIGSGCDSGFCVAGVCCDSACDGVCQACSDSGLCQTVPADDARCPVITCSAAATTCATFATTQAVNRCESLGVCKTECDPVTVSLDTVCGEVAPGIQGVCDAAGDCVDPRAKFGAACQSSIDCAQGSCVDGVCCQEACGAACETCGVDGACVADTVGTSCGEGLQCFGRALCLSPNGSACQTGAECGSGNCAPAVGGGSACCAEACAGGLLCNGDGVCVSPESDLGTPCTDDTQCIGGRCFDGVCCDSECGAACERCNAPGQAGRCSAEPPGTADPLCAPGTECAGRGQCLAPLGAACALNGDCRSGECGAALQGGGEICCEAVCPEGQRCAANGSCVDAPRPDGSACAVGTDCSNGSCVGGLCCESACNGVCQACSGLGDCNINPGNDPSCQAIDCPTSNTVCVSFPADLTTNLCAAFGSCRNQQQECQPRFAAPGTPCEAVAPGVLGLCDGSGTCTDPRVGVGIPCSTGAQCASGSCVPTGTGSICCDAPCDGICEACAANGVCGLQDNGRCPAGQQCATRTSCEARTVVAGASCANGEACAGGAVCLGGLCRGQCQLVADGATDGSRYDQCVLAP